MRTTNFVLAAGGSVLLAVGLLGPLNADKPTSQARDRIRQALEGSDGGSESGDGVLEGVLDVIQARGSVLRGSALEAPVAVRGGLGPEGTAARARAVAAEQLLKAARLLEALETPSSARGDLIGRMRNEAASVLATSAP